ncbi:hypothetical protein, partial [Streptomyces misionensis]
MLFVVPTLDLAAQTALSWRRLREHRCPARGHRGAAPRCGTRSPEWWLPCWRRSAANYLSVGQIYLMA